MLDMSVIIEGSGRHAHLSKAHLEVLFGEGFELDQKKMLSQPGQYATSSRIDVTGPKGTIKGIVVLGPCRAATQVEFSYTDARILGIDCPVRESGVLAGSPGCKISGPCGEVELAEGCIIAKRHVHMTPDDAERMGLKDKEIVQVQVGGERGLIFDEVVLRVNPEYATYMHVDYDEINAACLFGKDPRGVIIKK